MTPEQIEMADYLNSAFRINHKIESLEAVQTTNTALRDKCKERNIDDVACDLADVSQKIENEIRSLVEARNEISSLIAQIDNEEYAAVLNYHYLNYLTMSQIAEQMHYDIRTVKRKHIHALNELIKLSLFVTPEL